MQIINVILATLNVYNAKELQIYAQAAQQTAPMINFIKEMDIINVWMWTDAMMELSQMIVHSHANYVILNAKPVIQIAVIVYHVVEPMELIYIYKMEHVLLSALLDTI